MEEFFIQSIVGGTTKQDTGLTLYLFNSSKDLAIPLKLPKHATDSILLAQQTNSLKRPEIYETLTHMADSLGAKIMDIYVYMEFEGIYYTYLRLFSNGRNMEIDIKFTDGLCMSVATKCPILFEEKILRKIALNLGNPIGDK